MFFCQLQVIAVLVGFVAILLMILVVGASSWVYVEGFREGLWDRCYVTGENRLTCQPGEDRRTLLKYSY